MYFYIQNNFKQIFIYILKLDLHISLSLHTIHTKYFKNILQIK